MTIRIKSVYTAPVDADVYRVLVNRVWPRGIRRKSAEVHLWIQELSPSPELFKWFAGTPAKWDEFKERYYEELSAMTQLKLQQLTRLAKTGTITLMHAGEEERYNAAVALKEYLESLIEMD